MAERGVTDPSSRRPLGSTGFSVSPVCVGAAPLGDMPATFEYSVSEQRAFDTLRAVFGSPLNFLDTAASYGDGESERRIGEALREIGGLPEGCVLATKADRDPKTGDFEAVVTHNRYTLVNRSAEPLLDVATQRGVAALNAAPYGSGILAKGPDAYARYEYREAPQEMVERVRKMESACRELGVPLAAAALQFSLRDPRVVSTIVGISRPERVEQTIELATHPIPDELWPRLDSLVPSGS